MLEKVRARAPSTTRRAFGLRGRIGRGGGVAAELVPPHRVPEGASQDGMGEPARRHREAAALELGIERVQVRAGEASERHGADIALGDLADHGCIAVAGERPDGPGDRREPFVDEIAGERLARRLEVGSLGDVLDDRREELLRVLLRPESALRLLAPPPVWGSGSSPSTPSRCSRACALILSSILLLQEPFLDGAV